MQIVDAISLAGGPTAKGNLSRVQVVRTVGTKAKMITVDFGKVLAARDPAQNVALQSGDIVYVTPKGISIAIIGDLINMIYNLRYVTGW